MRRARVFFYRFAQSHSRFMAGCVGAERLAGFRTRSSNPAQFATMMIGT